MRIHKPVLIKTGLIVLRTGVILFLSSLLIGFGAWVFHELFEGDYLTTQHIIKISSGCKVAGLVFASVSLLIFVPWLALTAVFIVTTFLCWNNEFGLAHPWNRITAAASILLLLVSIYKFAKSPLNRVLLK